MKMHFFFHATTLQGGPLLFTFFSAQNDRSVVIVTEENCRHIFFLQISGGSKLENHKTTQKLRKLYKLSRLQRCVREWEREWKRGVKSVSRNAKVLEKMMMSCSTPPAFAFLRKSLSFSIFSFSLFSCKIIGRLCFSSSFPSSLLSHCRRLCISCSQSKPLTLPDGSQFAFFPHLHIFFFSCLESCKFSLEVELCCHTHTDCLVEIWFGESLYCYCCQMCAIFPFFSAVLQTLRFKLWTAQIF